MSITTEEFNNKLEEIGLRLDSQAKDRHEINGKLLTILHHYEVKADQTAGRVLKMEAAISELTKSLSSVASSVEMIRNRLVGDSEMKTQGLAQDFDVLIERMKTLECEQEKTRMELSRAKTMAYTAITLLTIVGGLIQWIQATKIVKFLN